MNQILSSIRKNTSLIALVAMAAPALAQSRFDIADDALIDHATGLIWQSLAATAGSPLPLSPVLENSRVATLNELFSLLPLTAGSVQTISTGSDLYTALSFFSATSPQNTALCIGGAPQDAKCFGGWAAESGAPGTYDLGIFWVAATPGQSNQVNYFSTATMGNYSASFCSFACDAGQFTVRAIPEPSRLLQLITGLALTFYSQRLLRKRGT